MSKCFSVGNYSTRVENCQAAAGMADANSETKGRPALLQDRQLRRRCHESRLAVGDENAVASGRSQVAGDAAQDHPELQLRATKRRRVNPAFARATPAKAPFTGRRF